MTARIDEADDFVDVLHRYQAEHRHDGLALFGSVWCWLSPDVAICYLAPQVLHEGNAGDFQGTGEGGKKLSFQ